MPGFIPDSDSEDELPPGWEEKAATDGHVFYVNHKLKSTQWTHPRTGKMKRVSGELPIGWERRTEEGSDQILFYNKTTNQSTYTDPRLAFAVEEQTQNVRDVRQRFDASSTALQVLHGKDLSGKLAVITGANAGIGLETAKSLAFHGCEVILACRNEQSALEGIKMITKEKQLAGRKCSFMKLDLASLEATKRFTDELKTKVRHIDYLILNAAVMGLPHTLTVDGLEITFQVCHLSHFYLTLELESLLDHNSRVVIVSSESHRFANLPVDHLTEPKLSPPARSFWSMMAYNNAKLCNVLFARQLAKNWQQRGISVFALHPGNMISTSLSRNYWIYRLLFAVVRPFTKSLQQGASTTVYCATADELKGLTGLYFNNCFFCEPSKLAQNDAMAESLWKISEEMIASRLNRKAM
ncbi:unnamed protein product [Hermetia illucens]|uniref:WW domain-containing oxidoreductase n=1 Tax=Hermetia illucens TaxID=343691 RepID=A0A7R8USW7_HERIL|nr:WW domain-containing oxidoreductase [Hermetia illucens]CAD7086448.1 unnamed protein product [Hermetia illucens]